MAGYSDGNPLKPSNPEDQEESLYEGDVEDLEDEEVEFEEDSFDEEERQGENLANSPVARSSPKSAVSVRADEKQRFVQERRRRRVRLPSLVDSKTGAKTSSRYLSLEGLARVDRRYDSAPEQAGWNFPLSYVEPLLAQFLITRVFCKEEYENSDRRFVPILIEDAVDKFHGYLSSAMNSQVGESLDLWATLIERHYLRGKIVEENWARVGEWLEQVEILADSSV